MIRWYAVYCVRDNVMLACGAVNRRSIVLSPHVPQIRGMIQVNGNQRSALKEVNLCGM